MADWASVEMVQHSLKYKVTLIYDDVVDRTALRTLYAIHIVFALLLASDVRIKIFGGLILASLLITYLFFSYAAISIWCFFAAVQSGYIAMILVIERRAQLSPT